MFQDNPQVVLNLLMFALVLYFEDKRLYKIRVVVVFPALPVTAATVPL